MSYYKASPILFEPVSSVTATPSTELGSEREESGKRYVYIYNGGAAEIHSKAPVTILTAAASPFTCSVSTTAGHMCMGVSVVSIATASYGWILKRGLQTISVASGSSSLVVGPQQAGGDGVVKTMVAGGAMIGQVNTAIVSGNTGLMWVNCPGA